MKKQITGVTIVLFLILGFSFYWFGWRPAQIRQRCLAEAEFHLVGNPFDIDETQRQQAIADYYQGCLWGFGLSK